MSKRVVCKFFAQGGCLKGDYCYFSHEQEGDPQNNFHSSASLSPTNTHRSVTQPSKTTVVNSILTVDSTEPSLSSIMPTRNHEFKNQDQPICLFAISGDCTHGQNCPHIHGDACPMCGKHCLHPFRPDEREDHLRTCGGKQKELEPSKEYEEMECSVCLERVMSKSNPFERKFGLMSECDHSFCISCIRNWRSSSPASGLDLNSALRSCPICRKLSYFVIPSSVWYTTKEDKQNIIEGYKAKLRSIDCKYFDHGNGRCPFGSSCFYKHTVKPGSYTWTNHMPPPVQPHAHVPYNTENWEGLLSNMEEDTEEYYELQGFEHMHNQILDGMFSPDDIPFSPTNEMLTPGSISNVLATMYLDTDEEDDMGYDLAARYTDF